MEPTRGLVIEPVNLVPKVATSPRVVAGPMEPLVATPRPTIVPDLVVRDDISVPAGGTRRSQRSAWLNRYVRWLVVTDAVVALVAAAMALIWRFGLGAATGQTASYGLVTLALPVVWVAALAVGRVYEHRFLGEGSAEFRRIADSALRLLAVLAILTFTVHWEFARGYAIIALPLVVVGTLLAHRVARGLLHSAERAGRARQRVLVIGTERAIAEMVRRLGLSDNAFEIVGALVDTSRSDVIEGVPVVGVSRDASTVVADLEVDAIAVAAWSTFSQLELRRLAWELEGTDVDVLVAPNLTDVAGPRLSIRPVAGLPLLHVDKPEFTGIRRVVKGLFDRGVALTALILLSPLLLLFMIAVRLDSPGPALFRQERVGRGGRTFQMLKFRSMHEDAERLLDDVQDHNVHTKGPLFKAPDDPRVTRVGRILRRASLDELPQLWNVLRGQMSLVGPRPPLPGEVAQYAHDVYRRLLVKPGLTGLWQVSGRSDLTWDESVRLDLYYVENWNLFLDVSILMRTFRAVVAARGAY
ncbi:MAG: sugar transferase [Candidatus Nanopelagicales bacterium]